MSPSQRLRLVLVMGLTSANILVLVLAWNSLFLSRQHYERRAEMVTQNIATALDQNLTGTIARIDLSLQAVVDELQHQLGLKTIDEPAMNAFLLRQEQRTPEVQAFRVARADGLVILGKGLDKSAQVSYADRDYFLYLKDHSDASLQVVKPLLGRVSKQYQVAFVRRYMYPDGSFAGIVAAAVPIEYFARMLSLFELGPQDLIALRDADTGLIARYPSILLDQPASRVGSTATSKEFREIWQSGATSATYYTPKGTDGIPRIVSFRRLLGAQMVVAVSMAEADFLGGWSTEKYRTISMGAGFLLLSLLLGAFLFRLIGQAEADERRVRQSKAEELRFKDDFLSHVSHELRSPLTAIKQFTSILSGGLAGKLNEEQDRYQAIVLKNVHQLQAMIDDLLEVTRMETGKTTVELNRVDVQSVAADAAQTLALTAASKGITLSSELPGALPPVYADPTRLLQVLIILLDNAVKFTSVGGSVWIRGRLLEKDPGFLQIEVTDTGCGIAPELQEKLFERLYQAGERGKASRKGLGLGLYICKELVMRQGGRISVISKVGKGSTFSFTLPLFSLSRLIAPLIKNSRWPAETAALLTVRLRLPGGTHSSESNAGPPHEARNFVQMCLLPDFDLLLPTSRSTPQGELLFVAVFADENGRSVLTRRIREHFEGSRALNRAGRTLTLTYRPLPAFAREVGSATELAAAEMAAMFENAVQTQILSQRLHDEHHETIAS